MRSFVAATLLFAVLFHGATATAQARDPAAAELLFAEGRKAFDAGDYATACPKFEESNRFDPGAGTLINLAACYEKQGKLALAWERWRSAQRLLSPGDERAPEVERRAAALEARLPRLEVGLDPKAPAGTRVVRDGVELGAASLGVALPVDPGKHEIHVSAPGHADRTLHVQVKEGGSERVTVAPGPALPAPAAEKPHAGPLTPGPAPRADTADRDGTQRTVGWVLAGVGAASLATGGVFGVLALQQKSTMDDDCVADGDRRLCGPDGLDAADRGNTYAMLSTLLVAGGAVALGAGGYLVLSARGPEASTALPNGGTITFGGAF